MKKKIAVSLIIGAFLLGGGTVFAAGNYYADLVLGQKEQIKEGINQAYDQRQEEIGKQVHNDMVMLVSTEVEGMKERLDQKLKEGLDAEQNRRMNIHSKEIKNAAEQLEIELNDYITDLLEGGK